MAELINKLMTSDRMEDMKRAMEDKDYRAQLMKELEIRVNG